MKVIKKVIIFLAFIIFLLSLNTRSFYVVADEDESQNDENYLNEFEDIKNDTDIKEECKQDSVQELYIWEEIIDGETRKIVVGWNGIQSIDEVYKYEIALYKEDVSLVGSFVEVYYLNEPFIDNVTYSIDNQYYEYEFTDIKEEGIYYCAVRACWKVAYSEEKDRYTEYTQSDFIEISDIAPLSLEIETDGWTDNTSTQIIWQGVTVGNEKDINIQYKIDDSEWTDSMWTGMSGSATFDPNTFAKDGEYNIKIRGKAEIID